MSAVENTRVWESLEVGTGTKSPRLADLTDLSSLDSPEAANVAAAIAIFVKHHGSSDAWFMLHTATAMLLRNDKSLWTGDKLTEPFGTILDPYPIEIEYRNTQA